MHKIDLRRIDLNLLLVFEVLMAERNVTRAAERLGRTQSAVSHSLARLRDQLGDPLLVKSGGRMGASPFAEQLVREIRPILSNIQRVLAPQQAFDPALTTREFRIAIPDLNDTLFPLLVERVRREAPLAAIEWVARDAQVLLAVVEGQIDIALVPAAMTLPDGIACVAVKPFRWASFLRQGHPAIRDWGRAAWSKWPHVAVRTDARVPSPVEMAASQVRGRRTVSTWVPHFSAVAPLLARTDLIATLPGMVMGDRLARFGLHAMKTPILIEPMPHQLIWSQRLGNDTALRWLRGHVVQVFSEVLDAVDRAMPG
ncbi:MAG: LysR family transcriptional regulator [Betaproteobacteria bacterium]|nr:LysR family transcriptional regulator [Betaproteobacteria bacterium]